MAKSKLTTRTVLTVVGIILTLAAYEIFYKKTSVKTLLIISAIVIPLSAIYIFIALKIQGGSARRRTAALKKNATLMGFSFNEAPDEPLLSSLMPGFELFTLGEGRSEFRNYMDGEAGGQSAVVFDYGYHVTKRSGENVYLKSINHTVCILAQDTRNLPGFKLRSKGLAEKVRDTVGMHDIDPENDPEFAKHCWLTGPDEEAVRALFGPEVTQAFRDGSALRDIVIEGAGSKLMYYHVGHIEPDGLTDFVSRAGEVSRLFG